MVIFGREINFSVFFGFNGSQKFPLFRWLLIPTAFFLIVIPSRILLLAQNRNLNHTTVISLEDDGKESKISQGLFLITNNLYLGGEIIYLICGCLITLFGIFGFLRRNNAVGQFISAFLIAFTVIHAISAAYTVLFSNRWIFRVLDDTWENSFIYDNELIHEIQNEFSCKGFSSMVDRSIENLITTTISPSSSSKTVESISSSSKKFLSFEQSCAKILMQRYGPHLFHVAKIIFLARFIQLLAVLLHTFILHCVIINDIQQSIRQEECEEYNNINSNINSSNGNRNNNSRSSNNSSNGSSNSSNNNYNNNSNYDDDKNYNDWGFEYEEDEDEDYESNEDVENFEDGEDNDDDTKLLLHHYRNRNHRKYLRYDEVEDVNDELIDELVEKNLDLIKFNNSILKSIYYNSRN